MLFSTNLLKRFINISDESNNLEEIINKYIGKIISSKKIQISNDITIGFVKSVEKHPNADRLQICQIDCGEKGVYQIVTGGENIKENIYVAVALPGCFLPEINIKIEPRKMRGIESNGMICSKKELGINEDEDKHWIWILDEDLETNTDFVGKSFVQVYNWIDNTSYEIEGNELNNHLIWATQIYSSYRNKLENIKFTSLPNYYNKLKYIQMKDTLSYGAKSNILLDKSLSNHIILELNNIEIKKSTFFMRLLVLNSGLSPINNWIDFTNIIKNLYGINIDLIDKNKITDSINTDNINTLTIDDNTKDLILLLNNHNYEYVLYCLLFMLDDLKFFGNDLGKYEIGGTNFITNIDFSKKLIQININHFNNISNKDDFLKALNYLGFETIVNNQNIDIYPPIWHTEPDIDNIIKLF